MALTQHGFPPWFPFERSGGGTDNYTVKISGTDTTPGFVGVKLQAGYNIHFTTLNPAANEILLIDGIIYWTEYRRDNPGGQPDHGIAQWTPRTDTGFSRYDAIIAPVGNGAVSINDWTVVPIVYGIRAVDLSYNDTGSFGARGDYSVTMGYRAHTYAGTEHNIVAGYTIGTQSDGGILLRAAKTGDGGLVMPSGCDNSVMIGNGNWQNHGTYGGGVQFYIGWGGSTAGDLVMNVGHQQIVEGDGSTAFGTINNIQCRQNHQWGNFNQAVDTNNQSINNYFSGFFNGWTMSTPNATGIRECVLHGWRNRIDHVNGLTTLTNFALLMVGIDNLSEEGTQGADIFGRDNTIRASTIGTPATVNSISIYGRGNIAEVQSFLVGNANYFPRRNASDNQNPANLFAFGANHTLDNTSTQGATLQWAMGIGHGTELYSPGVVYLGSYNPRFKGTFPNNYDDNGKMQEGIAQLGALTTGTTPVLMSVGERTAPGVGSFYLELPPGSTWAVEGRVVGRRTDVGGPGESFSEKLEALVENTGGVVRIVGQSNTNLFWDGALAACAVVLVVNALNSAVEVQVTGVAGADMSWAATFEFTQVKD